ncbi:MAG: TlpA family protein disulfide reductase [Candidatus Aminicenantes bacterium]|nr:TlpA family protein disulfide reductase [Candidatus Aminicenantes bacterium]
MNHRIFCLIALVTGILLAGAGPSGAAAFNKDSDVPVLVSFKVTPTTFKINRINLLKITFQFRDDGINLKDGYICWGVKYEKAGGSSGSSRFQASLRPESGPRLPPSGPLIKYFAYPFQLSFFSRASGSFSFYSSFLAEDCDQIRFSDIRMYDKRGNQSNFWPDVVLAREAGPAGEKQGYKVGQKAYDFTLFDKNNRKLTLSNYRGKVVLIDFSTMWCPVCIDEGHHLEQLYQAYKKRGFIVISAISEDDDKELPTLADLKLWASRNQMTFPVIADPNYYVNRIYYGSTQVVRIPYNVIIDRLGRIALKVVGYDSARHIKIENKIKSLL